MMATRILASHEATRAIEKLRLPPEVLKLALTLARSLDDDNRAQVSRVQAEM